MIKTGTPEDLTSRIDLATDLGGRRPISRATEAYLHDYLLGTIIINGESALAKSALPLTIREYPEDRMGSFDGMDKVLPCPSFIMSH